MKKALGREHAPNVVGTLDDAELVQRALARDGNAFRTISTISGFIALLGVFFATMPKRRTSFRKLMSAPLPTSTASAATPIYRRG